MKLQFVFVLLGIVVMANADQMTRLIGSGNATGNPTQTQKAAAATADAPIRLVMTEGRFREECTDQLAGMYECAQDGRLLQTSRYRNMLSRISKEDTHIARSVRIDQTLSKGVYLAHDNSRADLTFALESMPEDLTDGTVLSLAIERTERIFSYTSVLGAAKNIAVYRPVVGGKPADVETLARAFSAGKTFGVLMPAAFTCDTCQGKGTLDQKRGTFTVKVKCRECGGAGKIMLPAVHEVSVK